MKKTSIINWLAPLFVFSPIFTACATFDSKEDLVADSLLGNLAIYRGDYAVAAESLEKVTSENYNEVYLLQCVESAVRVQNFEIAQKCLNRLRVGITKELASEDNGILAEVAKSSEANLPTKIDRLDILEARTIAASYPGNYSQKFIEYIKPFNDDKKNAIINQTSQLLSELNLYERGVEMFSALVAEPEMVNKHDNQIFLAEYLRNVWRDELAQKTAKQAYEQESTKLSLLIYVETLIQNGNIDEALLLLEKNQNDERFADVVLHARINKVVDLDDEKYLRNFLQEIEKKGVLNKNISIQTKLNYISRWFDLKEYSKTKELLKKYEREVLSSRNPDVIGLYIYYRGITDLELAKNSKDESNAHEYLNRIIEVPRYARLIKNHELISRFEKIGKDKFFADIDAKKGIIMAPEDYLAMARVLNQKNYPEKAFEVLEGGLVFHENDIAMLYDASMLAINLNIENKMEEYLQRIIKINPDYFHAYNALGYTWADQNRNLPQAKDYIEKALRHQPLEPIILDSYGWYFFRVQNYPKALEFLNRANNLQKDPEITAHLIEVLLTISKTKSAQGNEKNRAENLYRDAMRRYQQFPERDSSVRGLKIMKEVAQKFNFTDLKKTIEK